MVVVLETRRCRGGTVPCIDQAAAGQATGISSFKSFSRGIVWYTLVASASDRKLDFASVVFLACKIHFPCTWDPCHEGLQQHGTMIYIRC